MDSPAVVEHLRELLRIPTVSRTDPSTTDRGAFAALHAALERLYPLVHAELDRETVAGDALLFRWAGAEEGAPPSVLMAHLDVVPADDAGWTHPPFAGELSGEGEEARIWGRGAIDDKGALVAVLEGMEARLAAGFRPRGDVYLCFGHNEETAGDGAAAIVELLRSRGVRPGLVLDEGGAVVEGVFPGVAAPIAVVGVSEKGIADIELVVEQTGGHASTPPPLTATTRLARALVRLDRHPARATLSEPTRAMIRALGGHTAGPLGLVFRHVGLFAPVLPAAFARLGPETAAMVRTTRAVTRLTGSEGDNVLAERATAIVNVRIAVDSDVERAVADLRRAIADPAVQVRVRHATEPSPVSPSSGPGWEALSAAIGETFPRAVVTPYVMLQASDARHFTTLSPNVYRFLPFDLRTEERAALHAIDESIRVSTLVRAAGFFEGLIGRL